ncbi:MAG TPA: hypothetical protein VE866_03610 [Candidatus Binatia bacterium]|nr:hypothetical protein [Candidatus Binatia bacterium]
MDDTVEVHLALTRDTPNSMNFEDTYSGLDRIWYKCETDGVGNITLRANADGFEHLARYFFKMARSGKTVGYHAHHGLEFGDTSGSPELTIVFSEPPAGFFGSSEP